MSNDRNYCPSTYLNTCHTIFTDKVGNYVKVNAERNNICDRSQLGMCSGVLKSLDYWIIDNDIVEEVRNQQRNLVVSSHHYQKAYDMVRHVWMTRVH